MAFSFDPSLPTARDQFRDRLDDLSESAPYYQDEQIDALIERFGYYPALLLGVNKIILRLGKKVSSLRAASGAAFAWKNRVEVFQKLRDQIEAEMILADYAEEDELIGGNVAALPWDLKDVVGYLDIVPYIPGLEDEAGFGPVYGHSPTLLGRGNRWPR